MSDYKVTSKGHRKMAAFMVEHLNDELIGELSIDGFLDSVEFDGASSVFVLQPNETISGKMEYIDLYLSKGEIEDAFEWRFTRNQQLAKRKNNVNK